MKLSAGPLTLVTLSLLSGCASLAPRRVERSSARVETLASYQMTRPVGYRSRGSFVQGNRKVREPKPWQWRDRDALGSPPESFIAPQFVSANEMLVVTLGGGVSLINAQTGTPKWNLELPIGVGADPLVVDSDVYIAAMDGIVRKLRLSTGKELWRAQLAAESLGGMTLARGILYVTTSDDSLWALDEKTGQSLWSYKRPSPDSSVFWSLRGSAVPLLSPEGDRVFLGFSDGVFVALDASSGSTIWERKFERSGRFRDADVSPRYLASQSLLLVPVVDGDLLALRTTDGTTVWNLPDTWVYSPTVDEAGGFLYYPTFTGEVHKVRLKDNAVMWTSALKDKGLGSTPVLLGDLGFVAVTTTSGSVILLDNETGKEVWRENFAYGILAPPSFDGRRLAILTSRNKLVLYRVERRTAL